MKQSVQCFIATDEYIWFGLAIFGIYEVLLFWWVCGSSCSCQSTAEVIEAPDIVFTLTICIFCVYLFVAQWI